MARGGCKGSSGIAARAACDPHHYPLPLLRAPSSHCASPKRCLLPRRSSERRGAARLSDLLEGPGGADLAGADLGAMLPAVGEDEPFLEEDEAGTEEGGASGGRKRRRTVRGGLDLGRGGGCCGCWDGRGSARKPCCTRQARAPTAAPSQHPPVTLGALSSPCLPTGRAGHGDGAQRRGAHPVRAAGAVGALAGGAGAWANQPGAAAQRGGP